MQLKLQRFKHDVSTTLGVLSVDGKFHSFTLEDEPRKIKIKGETRIPAGKYQIKFREVLSGKTKSYRKKFDWFTWHLELQNVPDFEYVYIHIGNKEKDTDGCILVAETCDSKVMTIGRSTPAFRSLYQLVSEKLIEGEDVWIEVSDEEAYARL